MGHSWCITGHFLFDNLRLRDGGMDLFEAYQLLRWSKCLFRKRTTSSMRRAQPALKAALLRTFDDKFVENFMASLAG